MWLIKQNKKIIDIYPVNEHICGRGSQTEIIKTYKESGEKPVLDIKFKKDNIRIDINFCPFCGKEL